MAEWFDQDTQQWYSTETEQWNPIEVSEEILPPEEGYTPPSWGDIGFEFTPGGYTAPPWHAIPFEWFGALTQSFNLGASITGNLPYTDAPYCTIKRNNIIALGFGAGGWQILKGRTEYSCMYDLNAILTAVPHHADLPAYIFAFTHFSGELDLPAELSGWAEKDLGGLVYGVPPRDLAAYLKANFREYTDLGAYIKPWHYKDLIGIIGSAHEKDIIALINAISPKDLPAFIKAYPQEDLPANIYGWAEKDLLAIIAGVLKADLPAFIKVRAHGTKDLGAHIRSWQRKVPFDLGAYIFAYAYEDLPAVIRAKEFGQIWATIYGVPPKDLPAFLYGWAVKDLPAYINSLYGPGDLQAQIFGVGPKDLSALIYGYRSGIKDLIGIISGVNTKDLPAIIEALGGSKSLPAIIYPDGWANLQAIITPRLVKFAMLMPIHTMEARDLSAVISLSPCYNLGISDLSAYLKAIYQGNLTATIYGFRNADLSGQIKDLAASISTDPLNIYPTAVDEIILSFAPTVRTFAFDDLSISFWGRDHYPTDELGIEFIPGGGRRIQSLLNAYINPTPRYHDLAAAIEGVIQLPYEYRRDSGLWLYDDLSTFTAPYILNNIELFTKIVQIRFYSGVYDYFYQSLTDTLWKEDASSKWIIDVSSWNEETEFLADKRNTKNKLVFDLTQFESIDEAIRYAIDWVLAFPQRDLGAQITSVGQYKELVARIRVDEPYSAAYNLPTYIRPWHPRGLSASMRIYGNGPAWGGQQYRDMNATITGS